MFKCKTKALGICGTGNFWEISDKVLNRIEGVNYLENKVKHNTYLKDNPIVAKKKFINIHVLHLHQSEGRKYFIRYLKIIIESRGKVI